MRVDVSESPHPAPALAVRLLAEGVGTGLLAAAVIGSGIMAERLSPADAGLRLLENTGATVAVLAALILALASVSGAHFNPIVTLVEALGRRLPRRDVLPYLAAQVAGACLGAGLANLMFELPAVELSTKVRGGPGRLVAEVVATLGLLLVVRGTSRSGDARSTALAVAGWIGGAYWFTSSTSFANPAVTAARTLSDTFAGIAPASAPAFVAAQCLGAALAVPLLACLFRDPPPEPSA